jgi:hypothetical protein
MQVQLHLHEALEKLNSAQLEPLHGHRSSASGWQLLAQARSLPMACRVGIWKMKQAGFACGKKWALRTQNSTLIWILAKHLSQSLFHQLGFGLVEKALHGPPTCWGKPGNSTMDAA